MKYSVTFKGLPFEPEKRQVIYVENLYDEHINTLIRDNYQQIKWIFGRANLDFIYLPMFFNDEETKEKVLYYAPYLTSEIIEKAELRSSYLLGYMSHQENREKITPSLLYLPKKDNEDWIFQGQTFDIDGDEGSLIIQWFEDTAAEIEEELSEEKSNKIRLHVRFDEDEDDGVLYRCDEDWENEEPQVEYSSTPGLWDKLGRGLKKFGRACLEEEEDTETTREPSPSSVDEILDEDVRETLEDLEKKAVDLKENAKKYNSITSIYTLVKREHSYLRVDYDYYLSKKHPNYLAVILAEIFDKIYLIRTFMLLKRFDIFAVHLSLYLFYHILLVSVLCGFFSVKIIKKIWEKSNFPKLNFYLLYGFIANVIIWVIYKLILFFLDNEESIRSLIKYNKESIINGESNEKLKRKNNNGQY